MSKQTQPLCLDPECNGRCGGEVPKRIHVPLYFSDDFIAQLVGDLDSVTERSFILTTENEAEVAAAVERYCESRDI